ncbi:JmjC domain-containing protein [Iodobacter fluviatilis]|uniref:Cupin superfamily protein n=1 Tax=Iodobacter fluviatilis TaxID=537 RepID=A0A377SRX2_9NEIS|nr:cupin domain-containing protein [Iodobacter fluviatilis]TCU81629.1 cupin superfamily protein [Iodobacter fluviatilis]STR44771.1 Cupin superfamily protein [Iodobacter fluviatilis]
MKLFTGEKGWKTSWLSTVKAHLHTSTLVGLPLENLQLDFFPDTDQLLADILDVFKRNRANLDISRGYQNGKRVESHQLILDETWTSIIEACRSNKVMLNICQLQREIPYIGELAAMLSGALCCNVRIDAFCSAEGMAATPIHYDYDNAFVVQMVGSKNWRCYDNLAKVRFHFGGYQVDPSTVGPKHLEIVMNPGDGIFIPGGTLHEAFTTDDISVHLAIDLDPILPVKATASWMTGKLLAIGQLGDAHHELTLDNVEALRSHAIAEYSGMTAESMLYQNHTYRLWSQSTYIRIPWKPLDRNTKRTQSFCLAPGAMFRMASDEEALKIEYATHVPAAATAHSWTFLPASASLPVNIQPILETVIQQSHGFTLEDIDKMINPDSTHVLMNALGRMGIIYPYSPSNRG